MRSRLCGPYAALGVPFWLAVLTACAPGESETGEGTATRASAASTNPDLAELGHPDSVLVWNHEQKIAGFRNMELLNPAAPIRAGNAPFPLSSRPVDLSGVDYTVDGESFDIDGFVEQNRISGLLVIHGGDIVHEQYALGNDEESRWVSFSIAKSVSSLLVGAAVQDGYIESLDAEVEEYVPTFEGTSYDGVRVRDVLQMASGVHWNEDYADPQSDLSQSIGLTLEETYAYMGRKISIARPGTVFNYNTAETHVVGAVVREASGTGLAEYLTEKIWQPFGMEHDASWMLGSEGGPEYAGCCINATLRDYDRLGMFVLNDGVLPDGTRVLPEGWMRASTTPSSGYDGYGYLWWLRGADEYAAIGIFGQMIHVDPSAELIIVTHSAWGDATGNPWSAHRAAFVEAVTEALAAG